MLSGKPADPESWYIFDGQRLEGPLSSLEMGEKIGANAIAPDDMVWSPEFGDWRPAHEILAHLEEMHAKTGEIGEDPLPAPTPSEPKASAPDYAHRRWWGRSYVMRHWRGELSLPISYFVNGFLASIVAMAVTYAVGSVLSEHYSPWTGFLGLSAIWGIIIALTVWQTVGIWRSATRHPSRGGRPFWATAAKFMVIVGLIQTASVLSNNAVPQIRESFRIVSGDPSVGAFHVRILNAGREVEFSGGIAFGATRELERILDAASEVQTVHLNSRGGRIGEAEKMHDLIRRRHLDTYTANECLSACTIAYLGGVKRYLNRRGRLGFHAGSFPGVPAGDMRSENQHIAAEVASWGVDRRFADKAYLSPAGGMWFPTHRELLRAHFVTQIADGQFALSGFGAHPTPEKVAAILKEASIFKAIAEVEPKTFDEITNQFYDGALKGVQEYKVTQKIRSYVIALLFKYLSSASDDAVFDFGNVLVDEIRTINAADPLACYAYLFPDPGHHLDVTRYIGRDLLHRELNATENIIRTGIHGHGLNTNKERTDALFQMVFAKIFKAYGTGVVKDIATMADEKTPLEKRKVCPAAGIFYSEIMSLPKADAAYLIRVMMSDQSPD